MKKIRILHIEFEDEIAAREIPAFRGAIVKTAGVGNILYHNHIDNKFRYSYPLIQYKQINRHPAIICIEEGVEEIHHFFNNKQEGLVLGGRQYELKLSSLNLNQFTMQVWDKSFHYHIRNWLPFSQENYKKYKEINDKLSQLEFLEKILTGNILSFAKGIGWHVEKEIKLRINEIKAEKVLYVKSARREAMSLNFTTNIFLPNYIGLGKNASVGFGVVKKIKIHEFTNKK